MSCSVFAHVGITSARLIRGLIYGRGRWCLCGLLYVFLELFFRAGRLVFSRIGGFFTSQVGVFSCLCKSAGCKENPTPPCRLANVSTTRKGKNTPKARAWSTEPHRKNRSVCASFRLVRSEPEGTYSKVDHRFDWFDQWLLSNGCFCHRNCPALC